MTVYINSKQTELPDTVGNLAQLLAFLNVPSKGTGIAVNNKMVKAIDWDHSFLKPEDRVLIISATFGG